MKHAFGLEIPESLADACDPRRTALIVYDMQEGVLAQIERREEITARVTALLSAAREAGMRVFFLRHMSMPRELMGVFQFRMAMAWQRVDSPDAVRPWFTRDSPGFQLVPEMSPLPSEVVFDKITMSAFEGTPLDIAMRDCGVNAFIIAGVAMEIGIEPTVRHGTDLGYIPIVATDACGGGHAEAAARALDSMAFHGDAMFATVEQISAALTQGRPVPNGG
jgi:nicotinamidase-related amidase